MGGGENNTGEMRLKSLDEFRVRLMLVVPVRRMPSVNHRPRNVGGRATVPVSEHPLCRNRTVVDAQVSARAGRETFRGVE